jgi:hypothetical protein
MNKKHLRLTVEIDKAGTTLAIRLCPSLPKAAAAAATPSTSTNGTTHKDAHATVTAASADSEAQLFSGTLRHAAARAAAVFIVFAVVMWWLWGCTMGIDRAAEDGVMSAAGVLCGLAACVMWMRTLLFVFFQVALS